MPIWNSLICTQGQTEGEENQEESADESFNEGSEVEENQDDSPVTDPYEDGASDDPGQIVENSEEDRPAENMPESNQEEEPPGSAEDKDQGIPESTDHGDNSKDNDAAADVGTARDAAENNTMDAAAGEVETVESEDEESVSETAKNGSLIASGIINSSIYWELYDDDSLYISGKGAIPDFEDSIAPWSYYFINLPESVTKIEDDIFLGKNTVISCTYDSYAMNYAIRHKIKFKAFGFVKVNKATVTGLSARTYTGSASLRTIQGSSFLYW